jgi:hypothetical protein
MNVGNYNITLKNDDGSTGTAANRFALTGDLVLSPKQSAILIYDSTSSRWRQIANGMATGSGDNLGNHTATQNIKLGTNYLSGDGDNEGVQIDTDGTFNVKNSGGSIVFDTGGNLGVVGDDSGLSFLSADWNRNYSFDYSPSPNMVEVTYSTLSPAGTTSIMQYTPTAVNLTAAVSFNGVNSPAQITSNQNDYNPSGLSVASVLRLSSNAARTITGLQGGAGGRIITVMNVGSYAITLKNASGSSSAANRFAFTGDLALASGQSTILMYDGTSSVWRQVANGTASGGSASFPLLASPVGSATAPAYSFTGDTNTGMYAATTGKLSLATGGTERVRITSTGMSINQAADPSVALDVTGDIEYSGTITDVSDMRLKKDITPLNTDDIVSRLAQVKTYTFRMKNDPKNQIEYGVMAQEVEKIFPDLVKTKQDAMGTKSVNYVGFIAPLIETSKALKAENDNLKAQVAKLEADRDSTHAALDDMRREINGMKAYTGYGTSRAEMSLGMLIGMGATLSLLLAVGGFIRLRRPKKDAT